MPMYVYERGPIDFWVGWMSEALFKTNTTTAATEGYEELKKQAFQLAKKIGWEGDVRDGPYIAGLPTHDLSDDGYFLIAWKQDNNGHTFVASPYRLPWLERDGSVWASSDQA